MAAIWLAFWLHLAPPILVNAQQAVGCFAGFQSPQQNVVFQSSSIMPDHCTQQCNSRYAMIGPTPADQWIFSCACSDTLPSSGFSAGASCLLLCPGAPNPAFAPACGGYLRNAVAWSFYATGRQPPPPPPPSPSPPPPPPPPPVKTTTVVIIPNPTVDVEPVPPPPVVEQSQTNIPVQSGITTGKINGAATTTTTIATNIKNVATITSSTATGSDTLKDTPGGGGSPNQLTLIIAAVVGPLIFVGVFIAIMVGRLQKRTTDGQRVRRQSQHRESDTTTTTDSSSDGSAEHKIIDMYRGPRTSQSTGVSGPYAHSRYSADVSAPVSPVLSSSSLRSTSSPPRSGKDAAKGLV
ncbi:hypothetical protein BDR26DRAFT_860160, partial [Obelidium mucronatum]